MTEADWLTSGDPEAMLAHLQGRLGDRKLRLFACACCRRVWHLVTDEACCQAILLAERFADDLAGMGELETAHSAAQRSKPLFADANWSAAWTAAPAVERAVTEACQHAARAVAKVASEAARIRAWATVYTGALEADRAAAWSAFESASEAAWTAEQRAQAAIPRELVGNPFSPNKPFDNGSPNVLVLAQAMYGGEPCAFALHDALIEAGQQELAEHFQSPVHPKGCWVIDHILGRK
jgi:hypothetical protein